VSDSRLKTSAWSPLLQPVFRGLWIAALFSNVGSWMHDVAGAWLMTSLAPKPIMVALMQTASTMPIFLLSLPAGAMADVADRRRLLIFFQLWMTVAAAVIGLLTVGGLTTPLLLLVLTFALQIGSAFSGPAWQAIVPELVPRTDLPGAVALGAMGFNISRAIGPALGGLVAAAFGPGAVFLLNGASFLGVVVVIYRWRRPVPESALPTERFFGAIRTGMRYVMHAPELHALFIPAFLFAFCASALWGLLPLLARTELGLTSFGYGVMLGCLGAGAVLGALVLPEIRRRFPAEHLIALSQLLFALVLIVLSVLHNALLAGLAMAAGGVAWLSIFSTLTAGVQLAVPSWVRGRVMASYGIVFFGGLAGGSALWGVVASFVEIPATLLIAAISLGAALLFGLRYRMPVAEKLDTRPSRRWAGMDSTVEADPDQGPVLVTVEYRIDPGSAGEFARAMRGMRRIRLRNGAIEWGLFHDTVDMTRYVEFFIVESWLDHLRQHERFTVSDLETAKHIESFHMGEDRPVVSHMIYAYGSEPRK
jgi:MFS family permease